MKTLVEVIVVAALAYYIAASYPAFLGIYYATMVIVSVIYATRSRCTVFAAMMVLMAVGYSADELTDWEHPYVVMNVNILLGVIVYNWCGIEGSKANEYIAAVFVAKALWGGFYINSGMIPIGIYAMILNFMSIIEWVWFANMSIDRRKYLTIQPQERLTSLYLKTPWITQRK